MFSTGSGLGPRAAFSVDAVLPELAPSRNGTKLRDAASSLRAVVAMTGAKKAVGERLGALIDICEACISFCANAELAEDEEFEDEGIQAILELLKFACEADDRPEFADEGSQPSVGNDVQRNVGTLSGEGAVTFEWLEIPLRNSDALLGKAEWFETVLSLLKHNRNEKQGFSKWVRLAALALLTTLGSNRPKKLEEAILAAPAAMEKLVDVLEDPEEAVRNEMLILLRTLTESSEQLQNFVAFRDGFSKLFQIIDIEREFGNEMIVVDCLTIMNWMLRGNPLTQKLFVQSGQLVDKLEQVLELPRTDEDGPSKLATPGSVQEVDLTCSPVRMHFIRQGLELISNLVSGLCPEEILQQPWFDQDEELTPRSNNVFEVARERRIRQGESLGPQDMENRQRHEVQLREMQSIIGKKMKVVKAIAEVAFCLPVDDSDVTQFSTFGEHEDEEEESHQEVILHWSDLRQQALFLLGDLACENEEVALQVVQMQILAPENSAMVNAVFHSNESLPTSVRGSVVCGALMLAIRAHDVEKAAASYFIECLFFRNPSVQISFVGHAMTPPPDEIIDGNFSSRLAPAAGRMLVDSFLGLHDNELDVDVMLRCGRMIETLLRDNSTAKELALQMTVGESLFASSNPLADDEFFPAVLAWLARNLRQRLSKEMETKVVLRLLVEWLKGSDAVCDAFLGSPVSLLFNDIASGLRSESDLSIRGMVCLCLGLCIKNRNLLDRVSNKIGFEVFTEQIRNFIRSPEVRCARMSKRARTEASRCHESSDGNRPSEAVPLFDRRFAEGCTALFDQIEREIIDSYTRDDDDEVNGQEEPTTSEDVESLKAKISNFSAIGSQYKNIIRMQDAELQKLKAAVSHHDIAEGALSLKDQHGEIEQLKRTIDNLKQEKHDLQEAMTESRNGPTAYASNANIMFAILDKIRGNLRDSECNVLIDMARCWQEIANPEEEFQVREWVVSAAELSSALSNNEIAVKLFAMAQDIRFDSSTEESLSLAKSRRNKVSSDIHAASTLHEDLEEMRKENADLVVLLANQEIDKLFLRKQVQDLKQKLEHFKNL